MDNISSIRQNREVEQLRMWNGDTEEVSVEGPQLETCAANKSSNKVGVNTNDNVKSSFSQENMDMYSRVKRRKSMRRGTYSMPAHHKVISKAEQEEEEEGTEGRLSTYVDFMDY